MPHYDSDIPRCFDCDQEMLVRAGGTFECGSCGDETTLERWDNERQNEAERQSERSLNSSAWDDYRAAYEDAQYRAMQVKRDFLP